MMAAPEPLSDDAAEADVLEQRAETAPEDDDDGPPWVSEDDVTGLDADPADVAEQRQVVPMDSEERDDSP
jgi:hypothetical protein